LVGGSSPDRGRVEVCHYNMWGTVCDDFWSSVDARVACRQLGYSSSLATAYSSAAFGRGSGPILIDNVACTGRENRLIDCTFDNNTGDCSHSEDAGVRCYSPPSIGCAHGDIRLVGTGSSSTQGRVEVCVNNRWGTVCDDSWSTFDARVACRQLGYSDRSKYLHKFSSWPCIALVTQSLLLSHTTFSLSPLSFRALLKCKQSSFNSSSLATCACYRQ